jgi:hypothetical protein
MTPRRDPWLLTRLFDLSFSRFVAVSLVRIVYAVLMVIGLAGLGFLITFLFLLNQRFSLYAAIILLMLSPFLYLVYLLVLRVLCEALIVVFAIAEDLSEIRDALRQQAEKAPPASGRPEAPP